MSKCVSGPFFFQIICRMKMRLSSPRWESRGSGGKVRVNVSISSGRWVEKNLLLLLLAMCSSPCHCHVARPLVSRKSIVKNMELQREQYRALARNRGLARRWHQNILFVRQACGGWEKDQSFTESGCFCPISRRVLLQHCMPLDPPKHLSV